MVVILVSKLFAHIPGKSCGLEFSYLDLPIFLFVMLSHLCLSNNDGVCECLRHECY